MDPTDIETAIAFVKARQQDLEHEILHATQAAITKFTAATGLAPHAIDIHITNTTPINSKVARVVVSGVRTSVKIAPPESPL